MEWNAQLMDSFTIKELDTPKLKAVLKKCVFSDLLNSFNDAYFHVSLGRDPFQKFGSASPYFLNLPNKRHSSNRRALKAIKYFKMPLSDNRPCLIDAPCENYSRILGISRKMQLFDSFSFLID